YGLDLTDNVVVRQTVDTMGTIVNVPGGYIVSSPGLTLSGHVSTPEGAGLRNAMVTITDADGGTRSTVTSSFGSFSFDGLESGKTYILSVQSKRYRFAPQLVQFFENIAEIDLTGIE